MQQQLDSYKIIKRFCCIEFYNNINDTNKTTHNGKQKLRFKQVREKVIPVLIN